MTVQTIYCSPQLKEFLIRYYKVHGMTQQEFASLLDITSSRFYRCINCKQPIGNKFINSLYAIIEKEAFPYLKRAIKTCWLINHNNLVSELLSGIKVQNNWTTKNLAAHLKISSSLVADYMRGKKGISKIIVLRIREILMGIQNLPLIQIERFNDVAFCALIKDFKSRTGYAAGQMSKKLNLLPLQEVQIDKCLSPVPEDLKKNYSFYDK